MFVPILWIKSGIFISTIWPAFVAAATLETAELANPAASAADSVENIDARLVSVLKRKLPGETTVMKLDRVPEWLQTLTQRIVRDNIPHKYVRDKDWGKTAERWDGIQIRRKGPLRLTTKRKWKEVKHGTWKRYEIRQIT